MGEIRETREVRRAVRQAFAIMAAAYGAKFTRQYGGKQTEGVLRVWERGLADVSDESIGAGSERAAKSPDANVPTLGQFRAMCVDAGNDRKRRESSADRVIAVVDQSARARAWRACQARFARRVTGMTLGASVEYDGGFPVDGVVRAATLPLSAELAEHQRAFADLRGIFDEEWAMFVAGAGSTGAVNGDVA